ncbi:MAG: SufD family Fe-S cluster assembly protein [Jannaschia helgolandensis]|uniref:Fe-S cluster assembly protein SufD n=1 Tax=Jannaschia helgolandensis TaxID=188906 RepID=A0A1H7L1M2_9RHOB|nr:SufD family Fe-S cluster assembly protein [Jannaschia helgolandensis]SEK92939.1 Fe-S cluster assembly protein SufD [Jannaschia helgolandensis]
MVVDARKITTDERLAALTLPSGGGWLGAARKNALGRLQAVGLPTRRDEYWRYTNPAPFNRATPAQGAGGPGEDPFAGMDAYVITIDGDALDLPDGAPDGVEINTLSQAAEADIHWARDLYATLEAAGSRPVSRPFAMLNSAFATGGLAIRVTGPVARPIHIRTIGGTDPILHHLIKVDADASVTVLESGSAGARSNIVTEVDVADTAAFHHIRMQGPDATQQIDTHLFARLGRRATFKSFTLSANVQLTRNEAILEIVGDDASAHVGGAAFGRGDFHHDDTVFVTHGALNGESRQVFKKVLRDGATGVFQGKILVREGAQKTDGYQISQALLLDDDAQFLAKPELEIYADDVACSHGSTTGAIDETALFYLRSRGVPKRVATDLLVLSFMAEAVEEIADEDLRAHIGAVLADWLSRH